MGGSDGKGGGQTAAQEDEGVKEADPVIEAVAGGFEFLEIHVAIDGVSAEDAAEEKHFGGEERPHAQGGDFVLLGGALELMLVGVVLLLLERCGGCAC